MLFYKCLKLILKIFIYAFKGIIFSKSFFTLKTFGLFIFLFSVVGFGIYFNDMLDFFSNNSMQEVKTFPFVIDEEITKGKVEFISDDVIPLPILNNFSPFEMFLFTVLIFELLRRIG